MRTLLLCALMSLAASKPAPAPGGWGGWGGWGGVAAPAWPSSVGVVHQPAVAVAQPVVHAAPLVHAAPAATSYSSFQQVVHPVSVAHPVVHAAPVVAQPVYHAPVVSAVQTVAHAPVLASYGHGW